MHQPRFDIHHGVDVGEVARHGCRRAGHHARALAQVALLQRCVPGPAGLVPQRSTSGGVEIGRIAVLQRRAIVRDRLGGRLLRHCRHGAQHGGTDAAQG
jgi:hypothetical protein